jgi:hypothetical protein
MLPLDIARTLLSTETQRNMSFPTAVLIMGTLSQVEKLIELAERVCDPVFRCSTTMTDSSPGPAREAHPSLGSC